MKAKIHTLTTIVLGCVAVSLGGCSVLGIGGKESVCSDCRGQAVRSICSSCWGEGYRVEEEKVSFERCPTCLGIGQSNPAHRPEPSEALVHFTSICPSCSGRGQKRRVTPIRVFCQRCQGDGKGLTSVVCGRCGGSGQWKGIFRSGKNRKGWIPTPSQSLTPGKP